MKVKINGKIFKVYKPLQEKENRIEIRKGINMFDLMFFKEWFSKGNDDPRVNFKDNIPYVSKIGYGKLLGCFPYQLSKRSVILVYDKIEGI